MMENALLTSENADLLESCSVYIDDIRIAILGDGFDECLKEHDRQITRVLENCEEEEVGVWAEEGADVSGINGAQWQFASRWHQNSGHREIGHPPTVGEA